MIILIALYRAKEQGRNRSSVTISRDKTRVG